MSFIWTPASLHCRCALQLRYQLRYQLHYQSIFLFMQSVRPMTFVYTPACLPCECALHYGFEGTTRSDIKFVLYETSIELCPLLDSFIKILD